MSAEYITLNSRLTIKKGTLVEKKLKVNTEEGFTRFVAFIALLAFLAYCVYEAVYEKDYFNIVQIILILFWLEPHVKRIYRALFVNTWKTTIGLNEIKNITSSLLDNGLETKVTLHLKNGRKKVFIFRNAENQVEDFIHSLKFQENNATSLT